MPVGIGLGRLSGSRVTGRAGASTNLRYLPTMLAMHPESQVVIWSLTDTGGVTAADATGNNLTGTYRNAAGVLTGVALGGSVINGERVAKFTSGYVNVYSAGLNTALPRAKGSLICWAHIDNWNDNKANYLYTLEIDADNRFRAYKYSDNILYFQRKAQNVTKTATVQAADLDTTQPFSIGITWDTTVATPFARFFLNGQKILEDTTSILPMVGDLTDTLCIIGAGTLVPTSVFAGGLGFWGLWNEALTDAEMGVLGKKANALPVNYAAEGFTLAVSPDAQSMAETSTAEAQAWMYTDLTKWITEYAAAYNILAVVQNGDIVESAGAATHWTRAKTAWDIVQATDLPFSLGTGNHDLLGGTDPATYNANFGQAYYTAKAWWNGAFYEADHAENHYFTFTHSGQDYLILHLQYLPTAPVLAWADGVLTTHADKPAFVFTHDFLAIDGSRSAAGTAVWNALSGHDNIVMIHCGHVHDVSHRTDNNVNGHPIHQICANYQTGMVNGYIGYGYFRLVSILPGQGKIKIQTYSPVLHQILNDPAHTFDLDYQF